MVDEEDLNEEDYQNKNLEEYDHQKNNNKKE